MVAKARGEDASARQKERGGSTLAFPLLLPLVSYHCFLLAELSWKPSSPEALETQSTSVISSDTESRDGGKLEMDLRAKM